MARLSAARDCLDLIDQRTVWLDAIFSLIRGQADSTSPIFDPDTIANAGSLASHLIGEIQQASDSLADLCLRDPKEEEAHE
jgi:hypothetical protein